MKYNKEKLEQHIEELSNMTIYVGDEIIWEEQCGQADHFDKLSKPEQIALIDIFAKMKGLKESLDNNIQEIEPIEVKIGAIYLPEGYIFKDENGNVINATKIVLEKKKKEYPKTYEECCEILEYIPYANDVIGYEWDVLKSLQNLLICRDAYWKIAGEEMGLGKPDWTNLEQDKHCIYIDMGNIILAEGYRYQHILAFPTAKMRDVFYENFKEEIEMCKELL